VNVVLRHMFSTNKTYMKKIAILDMWASESTSKGPSKHWLYNKLAESFDIDLITLSHSIMSDLPYMFRTFTPNRTEWGLKYYTLKEHVNKTPALFKKHTALFEKELRKRKGRYDLFFQIGALCGPVETHGVPYVSYHDQTVKMVETHDPNWLMPNFCDFRDDWYALEQTVYRSMTKVVTYSAYTQASIVRDYAVPAERVTVIPTACKLSYPNREEALQPRKQQLLFVTTDFYRKGGDILLQAFPLIKAHIPGIELIIAGGKLPESVHLHDPAIRHVGSLSLADLKQYYLDSALLVHPARYDAFPNVVKEAMACGLPIVASGKCGIPEMLEFGEAGVIVQNNTPEEIARSVCTTLSDETLYRGLQERSLDARERYRIDTIGDCFSKLFFQCMDDNPVGEEKISQ
jgi:glycogen synthase